MVAALMGGERGGGDPPDRLQVGVGQLGRVPRLDSRAQRAVAVASAVRFPPVRDARVGREQPLVGIRRRAGRA